MGTTVQEILRETRELQTGRKVFAGTVPNTVVRDNIAAALTFDSPSQNGVFVQTFSREGEQFYHLTLNARQLLGVGASDSVEIDNLRLSSSTGACYDRYTLNLPPVYTSYYYGGFTPGFPSTRPAVGLSSYYTPYYTFRGTQRLDKRSRALFGQWRLDAAFGRLRQQCSFRHRAHDSCQCDATRRRLWVFCLDGKLSCGTGK
jgi:hypothetical protein